jgi:ribosome-associated protein
MIEVTPDLSIPEGELTFTASRSGGPGGQNVNKVATKVTLTFDVANSASLSAEQRRRVASSLATRISREGVLRVVAQRHRTQRANREATLERFLELLRAALAPTAPRVATRPSVVAKRRRVAEKKLRARVKESRRRPGDED